MSDFTEEERSAPVLIYGGPGFPLMPGVPFPTAFGGGILAPIVKEEQKGDSDFTEET